jgi:hypothetical protein
VPTEKFFEKNTMDLQWKMRANYNAKPCEDKGKASGARTMENNGKNNAKNNGNSPRSRRALTHRLVISTSHKNNRPPPRGAGRTRPRLGFQP